MKMYNTLSNVFQMVEQDYGKIDQWGLSDNDEDADNSVKVVNILKEYLKTGAEPASLSNVSGFKTLGGANEIAYSNILNYYPHIVISDGSIIITGGYANSDHVSFYVDCNGTKDPNTLGRDIFMFSYTKARGFVPAENYNEDNVDDCNPNNTSSVGNSCADRLLQEGKMNY